MRQLLHTLYVTDSGTKLFLEGEALQARPLSGQVVHIPLHLLESIVSFSSIPATPALMAACAHHGIGMYFLSKSGKLRFRVVGGTAGNVLLRQQQSLTWR